MITYVTAFLCGKSPKHTYDTYLTHFRQLATTGIHIVLFLDKNTGWNSFPKNVLVIDSSLDETWVGKNVPKQAELPAIRSGNDTCEYMMIQNTKTEFVFRTSQINPYNTEWFAWIDFGIGHVFKEPEQTFERIRTLNPPKTPCIRTAGIWGHMSDKSCDRVCWRFAGGFFLAHVSRILQFHEAVKANIATNLPRIAWEVNVWGDVERGGIDLGWFPADHDDTIIPKNEL